jgi:hypothetical protein
VASSVPIKIAMTDFCSGLFQIAIEVPKYVRLIWKELNGIFSIPTESGSKSIAAEARD